MTTTLWRRAAAEGIGTYALVTAGCGAIMVDSQSHTLNHLGVEVGSADSVVAAERRLSADGLETTDVAETTCCFAAKTETWLEAPDGQRWEWYVKHADITEFGSDAAVVASSSTCCP